MPARPQPSITQRYNPSQSFARPSYGSGFFGGGTRSGGFSSPPQQNWRASQRGSLGNNPSRRLTLPSSAGTIQARPTNLNTRAVFTCLAAGTALRTHLARRTSAALKRQRALVAVVTEAGVAVTQAVTGVGDTTTKSLRRWREIQARLSAVGEPCLSPPGAVPCPTASPARTISAPTIHMKWPINGTSGASAK